jgi:hypothetical protein
MMEILKKSLHSCGVQICRFLDKHLPSIGGENWWQSHTLNQLTYGQQGQARSRGIETLGGVDAGDTAMPDLKPIILPIYIL